MRDTLRQLRRLHGDVDDLERRVDAATAPDSIDLLCRGLHGDTAAAAQLRELGSAGKCGHMAEMLDAIVQPLAADGGTDIADEDLIRPEGI